MYKCKNCFCVLMVFLLIVAAISPVEIIAAAEIDYIEEFNDTDIDGLDIVWANDTDTFGVAPVYDNGNMYAVKTWVSETRPVRMTHSLGTVVDSGMFYVSFDFYTEDTYNDCYLRLLSGDTQFQICGFRNTGKFGHFLDFSKWALDSNTCVDYTYNKWYTVGVLFDMDSRNSYFYFGEKDKQLSLIETVALNEQFGNITDIVLVHSFGDYTPAMWDNIRACTVTLDRIEALQSEEKLVFEQEIYKKYLNEIYSADFQTDSIPDLGFTVWSEETEEHGICHMLDTDGNGALKTWVNSVYPKRLTHTLKQPISSGIYYITFDWQSVGGINDCYLRLLSGDKRFQICGFRPDGNFGQFEEFSIWALADETESAYETDVWYTVGTLLDMDLRKVYIYIGKQGETLSLCATADFIEDMTEFTDVVLVHSFGDYPDALWDNLEIYQLNTETAEFIEENEKVTFDKSITEPFACVLSTDYPGNIYHNAETADVTVKLYNRSMVYEKLSVSYEGLYGDEPVYKDSRVYIVERGEMDESVISLPVKNKYGFFSLKMSKADTGELIGETRVSNARMATDGVRNQKTGATVHMTRVKDKEAAFDILSKGGFGIVRGGDNTWEQVETQKGVFETDEVNTKFYGDATADNFEVLTILSGSNSLYAEEYPTANTEREGKVEDPPQSDGLIDKFEEYCYQTVVMYPDVKYFQIWNEWNNAPTFNKDGITGADFYARLLKAGYEGVKRGGEERGKEALVVAMAPTGTKPDWIEAAILALDGEKFFDIISVHPYTYSDGGANKESTYAPEDICIRHTKERGNVVSRLQAVYSMLARCGYSDVPVWAGEFGFSSYICGEEKQAQYAVRMMALCDGNDLLDKMLWYTFQNHAAVNETEQNYGMIRYDENVLVPYEAKPVYLAMSNYNALMAEANPIDILSDGEDNVYVYEFAARDGDKLYTVWTTEGEKNYTLNVGSRLVKLYDIYGNETVLVSENGSITFTISENMAYIKVSGIYTGLIQNERAVTKLYDLTDEDVYVAASAEGYENGSVLIAQYKNDILIDTKMYEVSGEDINIGRINADTDRICVFMWENMSPICEKLIIE